MGEAERNRNTRMCGAKRTSEGSDTKCQRLKSVMECITVRIVEFGQFPTSTRPASASVKRWKRTRGGKRWTRSQLSARERSGPETWESGQRVKSPQQPY